MKKYARFAALAALFLLVICVCAAAAEKSESPEGSKQTMEKTTVFTGSDGEAYDLFEIRKLIYGEDHKVYAVSGVYERVAEDDECYYGKMAEDGAFTYALAADFRAYMMDPETGDPMEPNVPAADLYAWYIDAYLGGEAPEGRELVFQYDLPEEEQETAEKDFWFVTTRIRLNEQNEIEYMEYYYVPWG